jgi:hypothetical protein
MDYMDLLNKKICEFEETSNKLETMQQYKLKDEIDFAILTMEELKEEFGK